MPSGQISSGFSRRLLAECAPEVLAQLLCYLTGVHHMPSFIMEISLSQHQQKTSVHSREKQRNMIFNEITRGFSHLTRRNSLRRTLGRHNTLSDSHPHTLNK
ncbi:hypothetical protein DNTS_021813, partial [Danionella cerebrum]